MIIEAAKRIKDLGNQYEVLIHQKIRKLIKEGKLPNLKLVSKNPSRSETVSSGDDLVLFFKGKRLPIEIKKSYHAQYGNSSFSHTIGTMDFEPIQDIDDDSFDTIQLLIGVLKDNVKTIDKLYLDIKKNSPPGSEFKMKFSDTVPLIGYQKVLNKSLPSENIGNTLVARHYNSKGVFYIQIGGTGFFHIGSDPLKLGVPELKEDFITEIRIKSSGKKVIGGTEKVTIQIVASGRLIRKPTPSIVTLDSDTDIIKIFGSKKDI